MKSIGLLGGMSWESSAEYYRLINQEVNRRLGGTHSARCVLYSFDFSEIEELQRGGQWSEASRRMVEAARSLKLAGAELLVICTNTMHKMAEDIENGVGLPLLHIADAAAKQVKDHRIRKLGLLGTRYTMEEPFYADRLRQHGLEVLIPNAGEREIVNEVIYGELVRGTVMPSSKKKYQKIIQNLVGSGAEGILLGCTEIGLLIKQEDCAVPVFDTTQIHAIAAVDEALNE